MNVRVGLLQGAAVYRNRSYAIMSLFHNKTPTSAAVKKVTLFGSNLYSRSLKRDFLIGSCRYISTDVGNNSDDKNRSKSKTKTTKSKKALVSNDDSLLDKRGADFENYVRELPSYLAEDPDMGEMMKQNQERLGVAPRRKRHTMYKFVDKVLIEVRGGKGGNGCISIEDLGRGKRQPDGGNGGRGGNVYVVADQSLTSLNFDVFHFNGGHGGHGQGAGMTGKGGDDTYIKVRHQSFIILIMD